MLFSISRGSNFLIFTFFWIPAFVWLYLSASWPLQDIFFYLGTSYKIVIVTGCARKSDKAESWRSVRQKLGSDCVCTSFRTYMRSSQTQSRFYMRTPHVSPGFTFEVAKQSRNSSLTNHAYIIIIIRAFYYIHVVVIKHKKQGNNITNMSGISSTRALDGARGDLLRCSPAVFNNRTIFFLYHFLFIEGLCNTHSFSQ